MGCLGACWQWFKSTIFPPDATINPQNRQTSNIVFLDRIYRETGNFPLDLGPALLSGLDWNSIQQLMENLPVITAVPGLTINLKHYIPPRDHSKEDFFQFLLQYISNRKHMRKLTLVEYANMNNDHVALVCRKFLMAAVKSETIHHLCFRFVTNLHIQDLVELWRANRKIKVLELSFVEFGPYQLHAQDSPTEAAGSHLSMFSWDKMIINKVEFKGRSTALAFADDLARCLDIADIEIGTLTCAFGDKDDECVKRIVSSLMKSAILRRLTLRFYCARAPCITALTAGTNTVEELFFECGKLRESEIKFFLLIKSITEMVKLKVLHVTLFAFGIEPKPKKRFFRAIDASATLIEIHIVEHWNPNKCFNQKENRWLQGRMTRNKNLCRLVENPDDFSEKEVLVLMLQLQNCPTGRFQLARALPVSFFGCAAPTNSIPLVRNEARSTE